MELVYLWIEDYKNIQKQGFSFSPRFDCQYDEDTNKLTIDEKEGYINIFPENINITAIIGENGSGKSSILKALKKILDYIPYTELGYGRTSNQKYPFKFTLVVNLDNKIQYISSFDINTSIEQMDILGHYNYYMYLADEQKPINEELRTDEFIQHRFSLDSRIIAQMLTSKYVSKIDFELTTFMYLPSKIEIKPLELHQLFAELTSEYEQGFGVSHDILSSDMSDRELEHARKDIRNQSWAKKDDLDNIFSDAEDDFHRFLIIWYIREYGDDEDYQLSDKDFLLKEYSDLMNSITEDEFKIYYKENIKDINKFKQKEKEIYFNYCKDFFEFDFIDSENRRFTNLSHGEQTIFSQFLNIYYFSLNTTENTFLFLMDEPDLSLHPQWQKKNFSELYNLLEKINMSYHVLITTHSPFILSDLPKENVVFLKKGEQVEVDIDTFGANIHTLLSHGFFMKDGLMGEFAKEKINDVYDFLTNSNTQSELTQEKAQNIISIVGEPILKKELQSIYDKKFQIDDIDKKIREHKEAIQKLESQRDNND